MDLGIAPDDEAKIGALLRSSNAQDADILVTLGGASVGKHDLMRDALAEAGMELTFWKIAMRPASR